LIKNSFGIIVERDAAAIFFRKFKVETCEFRSEKNQKNKIKQEVK